MGGHDSLYSERKKESCNCIGDKKEGKPKNLYFFDRRAAKDTAD